MTENIYNVVLFQIDLTSKKAKLYSQKEFERLAMPITVEQWIILKVIQENPDISQKELSELTLRDPASITRTLDLLEKGDFVRRNAIQGNRRQYRLSLTQYASEFIDKFLPEIEKQRSRSTTGISNEHIVLLTELLHKIQSNLS